MTDRKKDLLFLAALLAVLIFFFSPILFTGKIIRAPDILNEYYWGVKGIGSWNFPDLFRIRLHAAWDSLVNSGYTTEGGDVSGQFLLYQRLIYYFIPAPASVAWFIVIHLFIGAAGAYACCRLIGAGRLAAFLGGLIFAIAPENASLINAGHVMKIATISFAPWVFYCFERGFQSRRLIWFLSTGFVLAFQFFNVHWQIAYDTCLCVGVYGIMRTVGIILQERREGKNDIPRLVGLNLVVMVFFLSTVAISLAPLAHWAQETNRGVQSGANQGKGGLDREEAMAWSLPPEEISTFVIPGLFGFSRQEAGENPKNIRAYYWGRMVFTQTTDYMGLLPWLLVPLPLIFRRDRYTWLAVAAVAGGTIFSLGKYTFVYNFLYDHFPGVNRFRVPKMMMFIPVLGLGVLAARGFDLLLDEEVRKKRAFVRYLYGLMALPGLLLALLGIEAAGTGFWINRLAELIGQPTRYQQGPQLVMQRWNNLVVETGVAAAVAAFHAAAIVGFSRKWIALKTIPFVLILLYLADVGRVDARFMFLVDEPHKAKGAKTPVMEYLAAHRSDQYRVIPLDESDPMQYATSGIPVMFTSNPVQQRRWQEFLDTFSFTSAMPDILNVKYLVFRKEQYEKNAPSLGSRYAPVFTSPDGEVVLENRQVLPKGWLVPSAVVTGSPQETLGVMQNPAFDPRRLAIVEKQPPLPLADPNAPPPPSGEVTVSSYEGAHVSVKARAASNALLVLGEKYYRGWRATVDGKSAEIYPVNHVLRGVYLTPGNHTVEFVFDPLPFKVGKYLTLASFALFALMLGREVVLRRRSPLVVNPPAADTGAGASEDDNGAQVAKKVRKKKPGRK